MCHLLLEIIWMNPIKVLVNGQLLAASSITTRCLCSFNTLSLPFQHVLFSPRYRLTLQSSCLLGYRCHDEETELFAHAGHREENLPQKV